MIAAIRMWFEFEARQTTFRREAAMEASWGQIDIDQFEKDWKLYIEKYLK